MLHRGSRINFFVAGKERKRAKLSAKITLDPGYKNGLILAFIGHAKYQKKPRRSARRCSLAFILSLDCLSSRSSPNGYWIEHESCDR